MTNQPSDSVAAVEQIDLKPCPLCGIKLDYCRADDQWSHTDPTGEGCFLEHVVLQDADDVAAWQTRPDAFARHRQHRPGVSEGEVEKLRKLLDRVLTASERAIGDHNAPSDCYATGPLTGDPFVDLVQCPACVAVNVNEEARAAIEALRRVPAQQPISTTSDAVERVAGLSIAQGIVEADLEQAKETGDADWIGLSQEALEAINAAIAALITTEREQIVAPTPDVVEVRTCPDCSGAGGDGHGHICYTCNGQGGVVPFYHTAPTPDAGMVELVERAKRSVECLADTKMDLSLEEWGLTITPILQAIDALSQLQAEKAQIVAVLKRWEEWEAKLLMDDRAWSVDQGCFIPQDLFDEYVAGPQSDRAALARLEGERS